MRKFIVRTTIILIVIISLPLSFLIIRQLSNMTENEKIVKGVFDKQIETILYSLNQTSENVINQWVNRLDLPLDYNSDAQDKIVNFLFENNLAIDKVEFYDLSQHKYLFSRSRIDSIEYKSEIPDNKKIDELKKFLEDGYQRIESVRKNEYTTLIFLLKNREKNVLGTILIHTGTFIEQNLGPSIQQVAQQDFYINVTDRKLNSILYSVGPSSENFSNLHTLSSWYLPDIEFSIQLRSATIDSLVKERSQRDNYIFIAVLIIVLLGIVFVIISIRKEIYLSEMKSEFVSNVSHEIRTPLALISMYSETLLLKRVKTKEKESEYLNVIHLESQRLSEMVNRILSFSKMEKNKRTYHYSKMEVNDKIEEVIYTFSPHLKQMNVSYFVELSPENPAINADQEAIAECIINLLDNAIKYGNDTDKKIWIRTLMKGDNIQIDIEDNGIGIARKHQRRIFEKFYRVTKGNLAHKAKGTGLGLNIVKQIVDNHGGQIRVNSTLGTGSCFSLIFPVIK